jgi:uncharacterized membrane protein
VNWLNRIKATVLFFWEHPSTIIGFVAWGAGGFGYQPSIGAFIAHFFIMPILLMLMVFVSHWEGRRNYTRSLMAAKSASKQQPQQP